MKHYNFYSYAADLGVFNQALYTTISNKTLFYYTPELWFNPTGCYFAVHFSPILFLVLPFYAIYPSPKTLLVFQAFLLAAAAAPLYLIAKKLLKDEKIAFTLVPVYLLYPPLHGANWFDFHQQIFIPILLFTTYYFYLKRSWKLYIITSFLALTIQEHLVYIVFAIGLYNFIKEIIATKREKQDTLSPIPKFTQRLKDVINWMVKQKMLMASLIIILLSAAWFLTTSIVKSYYPITEAFIDIYRAMDTFKVLGFKGDIIQLPFYILSNPIKAYEALSFDFNIKFLYIMVLFGPVLFLCLRSKFIIVTLIVLVPMLLTNYVPYYTIGAQYPLYLIPLVFIALVKSLLTLSQQSEKSLLKIMLLTSLIFAISTSPISPLAYNFSKRGIFWYPDAFHLKPQASYVNPLHKMIDMIPANASVLTTNEIFPHVSSRANAFSIPFDMEKFLEPGRNEIIQQYVQQLVAQSEFVLLNTKTQTVWGDFTLKVVEESREFGIYAVTYSYALFKRNYGGSVTFVPYGDYVLLKCSQDFTIDLGEVVKDETSISKLVVYSPKNESGRYVFYGSYICLPPGSYTVSFEIKVQEPEKGLIASFDVADEFGAVILAQRNLQSNELKDNWFNVTLTFTIDKIGKCVEFRIMPTGHADIYADRVIIKYQ
jgi:uncharacterized membrane protein